VAESKKDQEKKEAIVIPNKIPVLPLENIVVYPSMVVPLQVTGEQSLQLIDDILQHDKILALAAQREPSGDEFDFENLYPVATAASILKMAKVPDGSAMILIQGVARVKLLKAVSTRPYITAKVKALTETVAAGKRVDALVSNLQVQFEKLIGLVPHLPEELKIAVRNTSNPSRLADLVASNIRLPLATRQQVLETLDVEERLEHVTKLLNNELEVLVLGSKIQTQVESEMEKGQREYYLREQMKAIRRELGEEDDITREVRVLKDKLEKADLPEKAHQAASRELDRLSKMPPGAAEYTVARTYIDWILSLPWNISSEDHLDVVRAKKILDEDHYDIAKVKDRIVEYLAVRKLKPDAKGPILCFVGPPGVGKTSVGRSIARSLGREFVRLSLGGVRDEAEIRGHRRTYVGALPGRIIQSLRGAGTNNPVFMLDEVDKLGADFRGDPSSALLEVLDPEQNNTFSDHYLDLSFDLSSVMFIATANLLDPIPPALRDRMEVIELPGYTLEDKIQIALKYLVPRQIKRHGLKRKQLSILKTALTKIIEGYTREAGLRNLEREIATICRKAARRVAEGARKPIKVSAKNVSSFLGPEKYFSEVAERTSVPGVVTGLAWTQAGGEILFIESTLMVGSKKFSITGQLGNVMQESAHAALSWVKSKIDTYQIDPEIFEKNDIHVHMPAGAIPKDGPSAGITIATSLISLLKEKPVRSDVAMTGEITLRGKVMPVGGIKEKLLAAHRARIKSVILPSHNEKDTLELPEKVRRDLKLIFVDQVEEVIEAAFEGRLNGVKKKAVKKTTKKKSARKTTKRTSKKSTRKKAGKR
jgi:ATP-dependent Lon protease